MVRRDGREGLQGEQAPFQDEPPDNALGGADPERRERQFQGEEALQRARPIVRRCRAQEVPQDDSVLQEQQARRVWLRDALAAEGLQAAEQRDALAPDQQVVARQPAVPRPDWKVSRLVWPKVLPVLRQAAEPLEQQDELAADQQVAAWQPAARQPGL